MDFVFWDIVPAFEKHSEKLDKVSVKIERDLGCPACKMAVWGLKNFNNEVNKWVTSEIFTVGCEVILSFTAKSPSLCAGVIQDQYTEFLYPLIWEELLSEQTMCTFILELCEMDLWRPVDVNKWVFDKVNSKPKIGQTNDFVNKLYENYKEKPRSELVKVLMFSDLHVDYNYTVGASVDCGKVICCRVDSGPAKNEKDKARYWGEKDCDVPQQLLLNMFEFINTNIQPDIGLWGGDSIPHNMDSITKESDITTMRQVANQVSSAFSNFKVYVTLGNHDTYPQDRLLAHVP